MATRSSEHSLAATLFCMASASFCAAISAARSFSAYEKERMEGDTSLIKLCRVVPSIWVSIRKRKIVDRKIFLSLGYSL